MFEKPSTEDNESGKKKASLQKSAVFGAAMIAGVGAADGTYAEQGTGAIDWKAMEEVLQPETRASIERMRKLREQAKPRRHIELELDGEIVYEKDYGNPPPPKDAE